ncbi:MAG TPA: DUF5671 domain-containing protein [Anaerolineales bacterium]|nr:DUF5671 domain-containing protein [Anaerolineales bacterium]
MKIVRRLYFYAVAGISLEVVLWGLINLLRSIIDQTVGGGAVALAQALALILVGLPIFLFHWLWAQRAWAREDEEKTSSLRAIFLYAVLTGTLIPVFQNLLALIDRGLLQLAHLTVERALLGSGQTMADNLVAILMNGVVALYFWNILRGEWKTLSEKANFADVRRLYRYLWVLYSLLATVFGAQQVLSYLFSVAGGALGGLRAETMLNGFALLIVGTPVWVYSWRVVQDSKAEAAERESNLRLGVLYLLALGGVITVLTTAAMFINLVVSQVLGADIPAGDFIQQIGGPLSVGVPLGAVWAYYGHWLDRHIESIGDPVRQSGLKHVSQYILSALGLGSAFTGVVLLIEFIIDRLTGGPILTGALRSELATALALMIAWLPLWLTRWIPLQDQALAKNEIGDHARRSNLRKAYLYLALFAGVIGGMAAAVALVFELFKALFTGQTDSSFLATVLNDLQVLFLFAVVLIYHLVVLRRDGVFTSDALTAQQSSFPVLVLDSGEGFAESVKAALSQIAPHVPVAITQEAPPGRFQAVVLSGSSALNAPAWVRSFEGSRIIVPNEAPGLVWVGGVARPAIEEAAQVVRQLAEGQGIRKPRGNSAWRFVINAAAALLGLQFLLLILALIFSALAGR